MTWISYVPSSSLSELPSNLWSFLFCCHFKLPQKLCFFVLDLDQQAVKMWLKHMIHPNDKNKMNNGYHNDNSLTETGLTLDSLPQHWTLLWLPACRLRLHQWPVWTKFHRILGCHSHQGANWNVRLCSTTLTEFTQLSVHIHAYCIRHHDWQWSDVLRNCLTRLPVPCAKLTALSYFERPRKK